jgi:hypothetical protein
VCKYRARNDCFHALTLFTQFLPDRENLSRSCFHAAGLQQVVLISNTGKPQKNHTGTSVPDCGMKIKMWMEKFLRVLTYE